MHKRELPGWCQILDELTSEIAKERDLGMSEARRVGVRKKWREKKGGMDVVAAKLASTPTSDVVSTHQKKEVLHDE